MAGYISDLEDHNDISESLWLWWDVMLPDMVF